MSFIDPSSGMNELSRAALEIKKALPELEVRIDEPMSKHCSFRIGGPAAALILPSCSEELEELLYHLKKLGVLPLIIGNGTNLLVTDEPLRRIVIKLCGGLTGIRRIDDNSIFAESGVLLSKLSNAALSMGLTGLEFAHGIPGSVGGAVIMNAGAYGGEMKDVVSVTSYLDSRLGRNELRGSEHGFSYRQSVFSDLDHTVLGCVFQLDAGKEEEIRERMSLLSEKRRTSQPLDKPSAGSTFKRPKEGYAAAMIDQAGLRGALVGGARVSDKHAGFVINDGDATFNDVIRLVDHIREAVLDKFGIELEPEIKIIKNSRI